MEIIELHKLFDPASEELRFLPEGPYPIDEDTFSWVAIQHAADKPVGSLNCFRLTNGFNQSFTLPGRPGFARPTTRDGEFLIGLERHLVLFDTQTKAMTYLTQEIEQGVSGTIINDAVSFPGGIVFGCKDVQFAEKKAGLYLFRIKDKRLFKLRSDQLCSNGKIIEGEGDEVTLLDIDTPTQVVKRYRLNVREGSLSEGEVALDLRERKDFPDGMCAAPKGEGVIISFYNPNEAPFGETCQYSLATGKVVRVWRSPGSPQATCPQLISTSKGVKIVVTTAVENMPQDRRASAPNAGCLFIGDTPFLSAPEKPRVRM